MIQKTFRTLVLLICLIVNGCSSSKESCQYNLSPEEREDLCKFFRNLLLYNSGIYTLAGSKPITSAVVCSSERNFMNLPPEKLREYAYFNLNRDKEEDINFYRRLPDDLKEKAALFSDADFIYDFHDLWEKWEEMRKKITLSKRFLIFKRATQKPFDKLPGKNYYEVYFVDVFQTAIVLQENYSLFRETLNIDFDPLETALNLEDSKVWKILNEKGQSCTYLWGILFGYERQNSFGYHWKWRNVINPETDISEKEFSSALVKQSSNKNIINRTKKNAFTILKFPIPAFASFSEHDPVVKKFEKERRQIQKVYRRKDFLDTTLELLTKKDETVYEIIKIDR